MIYGASPIYLTENFRSTAHIINAANALIEPAQQRMKAGHPIKINTARKKEASGGVWSKLDPVVAGKVQILPAGATPVSQAQTVMLELQRLSTLTEDWDWSACAVIAREWKYLDPVRAFCELHRIPVQSGNEDSLNFWRLRETQALLSWLKNKTLVETAEIYDWLNARSAGTLV